MQPQCGQFQTRRLPKWLIASSAILVLAAVIALAAIPGCRPPRPIGPAPKPFAGRTLRVVVPQQHQIRELFQRHGAAWAEQKGAKLRIVDSVPSDADVLLFKPCELPTLVESGVLQALPSESLNSSAFDFGNVIRPFRSRLCDWRGMTYAIPIMGEALVGVYRSDLFDAPAHRDAIAKLLKHPSGATGPTTWQQVLAIVEYFSGISRWADGSEASVPRRCLAELPVEQDAFDVEFHTIASSFVRVAMTQARVDQLTEPERYRHLYDYQLDARTGEPRIADSGFVAALSLMGQLQKYRAEQKNAAAGSAFQKGEAVFALVSLAEISRLQSPSSAVRNKFAVCRVPGSSMTFTDATGNGKPAADSSGNFVPYFGSGGWMGGVAKNAAESAMALDFLLTLGGSQMSLETAFEPTWGAGPTRYALFELAHRPGWHNYGLSTAKTNQLVSALEITVSSTIMNPTYRLRIPGEKEYQRLFVEQVRLALLAGKPADATLREVARQWNALESDKTTRKHMYRRSLGLE